MTEPRDDDEREPDGDREQEARTAARELSGALRLVHGRGPRTWTTPVVTCSALTGAGVAEVWQAVLGHRTALGPEGLAAKRSAQATSACAMAALPRQRCRTPLSPTSSASWSASSSSLVWPPAKTPTRDWLRRTSSWVSACTHSPLAKPTARKRPQSSRPNAFHPPISSSVSSVRRSTSTWPSSSGSNLSSQSRRLACVASA